MLRVRVDDRVDLRLDLFLDDPQRLDALTRVCDPRFRTAAVVFDLLDALRRRLATCLGNKRRALAVGCLLDHALRR